MTFSDAIYEFFRGLFGRAVPSGTECVGYPSPDRPYAVYSVPIYPSFGTETEGFVDFKYKDCCCYEDDEGPIETAMAFADALSPEGMTVDYDGGRLYITRGEPFYKLTAEKTDQLRKCVRFKLNYRFIDPAQSLTLSDGTDSFTLDSRSEISLSGGFVGGRAESVTGKSLMDYVGVKSALSVKTCWLEKSFAAGISRLIARSPVLPICVSDTFASPSDPTRTADFIFDMPKITARAYCPQTAKEYVKLEITAKEQGLRPEA